MMVSLAERFTRYLLTVQCRHCSDQIYPHEDDARNLVAEWTQYDGVTTIDNIRQRVSRTCDGCAHMLEKDD
jgi:hypothetical protein